MIIEVLLEILKILGGVIVGAVLTYFFNVKQLKARYVLDIKSELGKKIANALIETRKYEQQTSVKAPFSPSLDYETEKKGSPEDVVFIPDIISSSDNLVAFGEETSKTRMEYEQYLSKETAVYLYIMEK